MLTPCCFFALALAAVPPSLGAPANEKHEREATAQATVQLKLNGIETARLMERYEKLFQREIDLTDTVRACARTGDERLAGYENTRKDVQADLKETKSRLLDLELEKPKLLERLGKKESSDPPAEAIQRTNQLLEKIVDRLISIEKRLEKMERQK